MKLNVFIPHRWNNEDYAELCALLDRTKFEIRDYSVPKYDPFDRIDRRFNVDPQIQRQIRYANIVVCSNRPSNGNGMAIEEIKYAIAIGKPVVAVQITSYNCYSISAYNIPVIPNRKDSLERHVLLYAKR